MALLKVHAVVDRQTPQGDTALHLAAKKGSLSVIKTLLAAGADPTLTNNTGYTPLHEAAVAGKTDAVTLLIDKSSIGPHVRATLLPRVRRAAELHGHVDTAQAILVAEASATSSSPFRGSGEVPTSKRR